MSRVLSTFLMITYFLIFTSINCKHISIFSSNYNENTGNYPELELLQKNMTKNAKPSFLKNKHFDNFTNFKNEFDNSTDSGKSFLNNSNLSKLGDMIMLSLDQNTTDNANDIITKVKSLAYSTINSLENGYFDQYASASNVACQKNNCFIPFGTCIDDSTCQCLESYANYFPDSTDKPDFYCSYEKKSQLVAFLLEFLLSNGFGHFYSGRILFGIFKMLVLIGPIVLGILMFCCNIGKGSDGSTCCNLILMIGMCLLGCTALAWQLADLIMFGMNKYADGNGIPLKHW